MLSDSIALQSVQGEFRCTGIPQVCEVCTAMALSCCVAYCGYLFRESWNTTTDTIANWTMLQSGKGALLSISRVATCSAGAVLAMYIRSLSTVCDLPPALS